ncbi:TPA: hypothetical protein TXJ06_000567 [Streptococcus suis]|uniref:hypothetical protein n=1 Tax=Streptococcus suis TaxID=1307 RepID=UPI0004184379|nr:hypothetical protein [Streptococcus suis]MBY5005667.1 hypothetical protein [Streptococcus suis]NQO43740.1 hypothetical protein [Streptococcus suis]NQO54209.1 hypothetical protein [Streptococcus suis]HEL1583867.1 hypothetical protein [Streptococcus suis]HEL9645026.1 hypothetical protein [Streptococcus suis]
MKKLSDKKLENGLWLFVAVLYSVGFSLALYNTFVFDAPFWTFSNLSSIAVFVIGLLIHVVRRKRMETDENM